MTLANFWGTGNWGNLWHQVRYVNGIRSVHSGHDIRAAAGTPIPALESGVVTDAGYVYDIGFFVEVYVPTRRRYDTYCHTVRGVGEHATLSHGKTVARVAGPEDNHGTMWTGPHLHFMTSGKPGAAYNRALTTNPKPHILAALSGGGAGGGGISLPTLTTKDIPMRILFNKDAAKTADATRRALVGETTFQIITAAEAKRERKFWGSPVNVTKGEWAATRSLVNSRRLDLGLKPLPNG